VRCVQSFAVAATKAEQNPRVRDRIRGVILAKKGKTAPETAEDLGTSRRAVQEWVRSYNKGGIKNLADAPRSGRPRRCSADKLEAIKKRIVESPKPEDKVCTLRGEDVRRILEKEFGVVQKLSATYNLLHRLGLEPLRPRPRHVKNDPKAMEAWKQSAPFFLMKLARSSPIKKSRCGSRSRPGSGSTGR